MTFVEIGALRVNVQSTFFSTVGMFSWVEPVLYCEDKVSCSSTQHFTDGGIRVCDLFVRSLAL